MCCLSEVGSIGVPEAARCDFRWQRIMLGSLHNGPDVGREDVQRERNDVIVAEKLFKQIVELGIAPAHAVHEMKRDNIRRVPEPSLIGVDFLCDERVNWVEDLYLINQYKIKIFFEKKLEFWRQIEFFFNLQISITSNGIVPYPTAEPSEKICQFELISNLKLI